MIAKIKAASLVWSEQTPENLARMHPELNKYGLRQDENYVDPRSLITIDNLVELKELIIELNYAIVIEVPEKGEETRYVDFIITIYDDYIE